MIWSLLKIAVAYPVLYILLSGNPWATLAWDFIVVGLSGSSRSIYNPMSVRVMTTAAGLDYNGDLWQVPGHLL